jgi:hypothetical protein
MALTISLIIGSVLAAVGIVSGIVSLAFVTSDRRKAAYKAAQKEALEGRSIAMDELELALTELAKMNRRITEELAECMRAKAALEKCKDG